MEHIKYTIDDILLYGRMIDDAIKEQYPTYKAPAYNSEENKLEEYIYNHKGSIYLDAILIKYLALYNAEWCMIVDYEDIPLYINKCKRDEAAYVVLRWRLQIGK